MDSAVLRSEACIALKGSIVLQGRLAPAQAQLVCWSRGCPMAFFAALQGWSA